MTFCCKVFIISRRSSLDNPKNIGICKCRRLSHLIIILGLKSMGMELSALIVLLRWVLIA
jgi:hypothetical protein